METETTHVVKHESKTSGIILPPMERTRLPNLVSLFQIIIPTRSYGLIKFPALMGRRPEPVMVPNSYMIPSHPVGQAIVSHLENAVRYLYMYNFSPLSAISSDIDPAAAVDDIVEELKSGAEQLNCSFMLVRDTLITENRSDIGTHSLRETASVMAVAIRRLLESKPPLPTYGVEGDDFSVPSTPPPKPPHLEIPDELVYDEIQTEIQEAVLSEERRNA